MLRFRPLKPLTTRSIHFNELQLMALIEKGLSDNSLRGFLYKRSSPTAKWRLKWFLLFENLLFYFDLGPNLASCSQAHQNQNHNNNNNNNTNNNQQQQQQQQQSAKVEQQQSGSRSAFSSLIRRKPSGQRTSALLAGGRQQEQNSTRKVSKGCSSNYPQEAEQRRNSVSEALSSKLSGQRNYRCEQQQQQQPADGSAGLIKEQRDKQATTTATRNDDKRASLGSANNLSGRARRDRLASDPQSLSGALLASSEQTARPAAAAAPTQSGHSASASSSPLHRCERTQAKRNPRTLHSSSISGVSSHFLAHNELTIGRSTTTAAGAGPTLASLLSRKVGVIFLEGSYCERFIDAPSAALAPPAARSISAANYDNFASSQQQEQQLLASLQAAASKAASAGRLFGVGANEVELEQEESQLSRMFTLTWKKSGSKEYQFKTETEAECVTWVAAISSARYSTLLTHKEQLEQKYLHLTQIIESESTAKWQYSRQCEEFLAEIKKLRAEICLLKRQESRSNQLRLVLARSAAIVETVLQQQRRLRAAAKLAGPQVASLIQQQSEFNRRSVGATPTTSNKTEQQSREAEKMNSEEAERAESVGELRQLTSPAGASSLCGRKSAHVACEEAWQAPALALQRTRSMEQEQEEQELAVRRMKRPFRRLLSQGATPTAATLIGQQQQGGVAARIASRQAAALAARASSPNQSGCLQMAPPEASVAEEQQWRALELLVRSAKGLERQQQQLALPAAVQIDSSSTTKQRQQQQQQQQLGRPSSPSGAQATQAASGRRQGRRLEEERAQLEAGDEQPTKTQQQQQQNHSELGVQLWSAATADEAAEEQEQAQLSAELKEVVEALNSGMLLSGALLEAENEEELRKIKKVQGFFRGWLCRRRWKQIVQEYIKSPHAESMRKRNNLVFRMVECEEEYVEQLQLLTSAFLRPIKMAASSQRPPLDHDELNSIFLNSETLLFLHQIFLKGLTARMESWPTLVLADLFNMLLPMLTIYQEYVRNHHFSLQVLAECKQREQFTLILRRLEEKPQLSGRTLETFLTYPMHQIPRYIICLHEILAHTPHNHVERKSLYEAQTKLEDLSRQMHEEVSETENIRQNLAIERMIIGGCDILLDVNQVFVRQGILLQVVEGGKSGGKSRSSRLASTFGARPSNKTSAANQPGDCFAQPSASFLANVYHCDTSSGSPLLASCSASGAGSASSASSSKELVRQCFLFTNHLLLCTRTKDGKLHLLENIGRIPLTEVALIENPLEFMQQQQRQQENEFVASFATDEQLLEPEQQRRSCSFGAWQRSQANKFAPSSLNVGCGDSLQQQQSHTNYPSSPDGAASARHKRASTASVPPRLWFGQANNNNNAQQQQQQQPQASELGPPQGSGARCQAVVELQPEAGTQPPNQSHQSRARAKSIFASPSSLAFSEQAPPGGAEPKQQRDEHNNQAVPSAASFKRGRIAGYLANKLLNLANLGGNWPPANSDGPASAPASPLNKRSQSGTAVSFGSSQQQQSAASGANSKRSSSAKFSGLFGSATPEQQTTNLAYKDYGGCDFFLFLESTSNGAALAMSAAPPTAASVQTQPACGSLASSNNALDAPANGNAAQAAELGNPNNVACAHSNNSPNANNNNSNTNHTNGSSSSANNNNNNNNNNNSNNNSHAQQQLGPLIIHLVAPNLQEKAAWMSDISQCIDNVHFNDMFHSTVNDTSSVTINQSSVRTDPRLFNDDVDIKFSRALNSCKLPQIRYASKDRLFERLTDLRFLSIDFLNTFLLTYRVFTTAEDVLEALKSVHYNCDRYYQEQQQHNQQRDNLNQRDSFSTFANSSLNSLNTSNADRKAGSPAASKSNEPIITTSAPSTVTQRVFIPSPVGSAPVLAKSTSSSTDKISATQATSQQLAHKLPPTVPPRSPGTSSTTTPTSVIDQHSSMSNRYLLAPSEAQHAQHQKRRSTISALTPITGSNSSSLANLPVICNRQSVSESRSSEQHAPPPKHVSIGAVEQQDLLRRNSSTQQLLFGSKNGSIILQSPEETFSSSISPIRTPNEINVRTRSSSMTNHSEQDSLAAVQFAALSSNQPKMSSITLSVPSYRQVRASSLSDVSEVTHMINNQQQLQQQHSRQQQSYLNAQQQASASIASTGASPQHAAHWRLSYKKQNTQAAAAAAAETIKFKAENSEVKKDYLSATRLSPAQQRRASTSDVNVTFHLTLDPPPPNDVTESAQYEMREVEGSSEQVDEQHISLIAESPNVPPPTPVDPRSLCSSPLHQEEQSVRGHKQEFESTDQVTMASSRSERGVSEPNPVLPTQDITNWHCFKRKEQKTTSNEDTSCETESDSSRNQSANEEEHQSSARSDSSLSSPPPSKERAKKHRLKQEKTNTGHNVNASMSKEEDERRRLRRQSSRLSQRASIMKEIELTGTSILDCDTSADEDSITTSSGEESGESVGIVRVGRVESDDESDDDIRGLNGMLKPNNVDDEDERSFRILTRLNSVKLDNKENDIEDSDEIESAARVENGNERKQKDNPKQTTNKLTDPKGSEGCHNHRRHDKKKGKKKSNETGRSEKQELNLDEERMVAVSEAGASNKVSFALKRVSPQATQDSEALGNEVDSEEKRDKIRQGFKDPSQDDFTSREGNSTKSPLSNDNNQQQASRPNSGTAGGFPAAQSQPFGSPMGPPVSSSRMTTPRSSFQHHAGSDSSSVSGAFGGAISKAGVIITSSLPRVSSRRSSTASAASAFAAATAASNNPILTQPPPALKQQQLLHHQQYPGGRKFSNVEQFSSSISKQINFASDQEQNVHCLCRNFYPQSRNSVSSSSQSHLLQQQRLSSTRVGFQQQQQSQHYPSCIYYQQQQQLQANSPVPSQVFQNHSDVSSLCNSRASSRLSSCAGLEYNSYNSSQTQSNFYANQQLPASGLLRHQGVANQQSPIKQLPVHNSSFPNQALSPSGRFGLSTSNSSRIGPGSKRNSLATQINVRSVATIRVLSVLRHWVSKHSQDFVNDTKLSYLVQEFLQDLIMDTNLLPAEHKAALQLQQMVQKAAHSRGNQVDLDLLLASPAKPSPDSIETLSALEIAEGMTYLDHKIFLAIRSEEFLGQAWMKMDKAIKAPHILLITKRFNDVSRLVSSEIIRVPELHRRVAIIEKWTNVAHICRVVHNFNGVLQICAAFTNSAVFRLKKTWDKIPKTTKTTIDQLQSLVSTDSRFRNMRDAITRCDPPSIPYVGMYLTDLSFIEEGTPNYSPDGLLNFSKMRMIAHVIREIQHLQNGSYKIELNHRVANYLLDASRHLQDDEMYRCSLAIEPRSSGGNSAVNEIF